MKTFAFREPHINYDAIISFSGGTLPAGFSERFELLNLAGKIDISSEKIFSLQHREKTLYLLGKPKEDDVRHIMLLVGKAVRMATEERVDALLLNLDDYCGSIDISLLVRSAVIAAYEASYRFSYYLKEKTENHVIRMDVKCSGMDGNDLESVIKEASCIGETICSVRDIINRTSRDVTPAVFAEWVRNLALEDSCEFEILGREELETIGAHAVLEVSAGSSVSPLLLVIRYRGDPSHPENISALLGKGITYDSGGLSLKSKTGMITMHADMSGAAAAVAVVHLLSKKHARINISAVLPVCENMLSSGSYRPGDIIPTMNGKSVLIKSTDAEGRLILGDAMTYAIRCEKAASLIDVATLTGGAVSSFGPKINAFATNSKDFRSKLHDASCSSGELVWEMPLLDDYLIYLKTEHADIANSSNGAGSSMINGALFLKEFNENHLPWLHIDCAGTAWTDKTDGVNAQGATGATVTLLYDFFRVNDFLF